MAALGARGRVLVIVGTTGVGKTKLSLKLARAFGGEVVNCDAMQVRRPAPVSGSAGWFTRKTLPMAG